MPPQAAATERATWVQQMRVNVPTELQQRRQWLPTRIEYVLDEHHHLKLAKPPYNPRTGRYADYTHPRTWISFEEALALVEQGKYDAVGYIFSEGDPYCGIDLDHCLNGERLVLTPVQETVLQRLGATYTERSWSGTGLHLIMRGTLPGPRRVLTRVGQAGNEVELYDAHRFFVFTGDVLGHLASISTMQSELEQVYPLLFPEPPRLTSSLPSHPPLPTLLTDQDILARLAQTRAATTVEALWQGDWRGAGYSTQSHADLALTSLLALVSRDPIQVERLFRQSGLMRPKWDAARTGGTYGTRTLDRAFQNLPEPIGTSLYARYAERTREALARAWEASAATDWAALADATRAARGTRGHPESGCDVGTLRAVMAALLARAELAFTTTIRMSYRDLGQATAGNEKTAGRALWWLAWAGFIQREEEAGPMQGATYRILVGGQPLAPSTNYHREGVTGSRKVEGTWQMWRAVHPPLSVPALQRLARLVATDAGVRGARVAEVGDEAEAWGRPFMECLAVLADGAVSFQALAGATGRHPQVISRKMREAAARGLVSILEEPGRSPVVTLVSGWEEELVEWTTQLTSHGRQALRRVQHLVAQLGYLAGIVREVGERVQGTLLERGDAIAERLVAVAQGFQALDSPLAAGAPRVRRARRAWAIWQRTERWAWRCLEAY